MPTLFQINVAANWGSTGRIAEEIGQLAMANGWHSYIAYGRYANPSRSQLYKIGSRLDQALHLAATRLLDRHALCSTLATQNLIEVISQAKPDIVHLHNLHGYYLNAPLLLSHLAKTRIPVVMTLHDCWNFTGHCAYFDYYNCQQWRNEGCAHCQHKETYPTAWLTSRAAKNYAEKKAAFDKMTDLHLVTVSHWLEDLVGHSFLSKHDLRTIHNGINLQTFQPQADTAAVRQRLGIGERKMVLGVASVWTDRKGLPDFTQLRQQLDQDAYAIVLVGLSEAQLAQLPKGITGIRRTNSVQELAALYSAADVFVNPTWEDNFPTTNLESLACGTPVITYRTGGAIEPIDEHTGVIVEQGDIQSLASHIATITHHPKHRYTPLCRQRAERLYNKEDRYQEYLQLYEELRG